jgi:hypothetical protein
LASIYALLTKNEAGTFLAQGPVKKLDSFTVNISKPGRPIFVPRTGQHDPPKEKGLFMLPQLIRFFTVFSLLVATAGHAESKTYSVFDIKKTLPLHGKQQTFRDYYVNLGSKDGAKAGSILAVYRRQGVVDYYRNVLHDDLLVPVAHMKIIMAQKTMSVARVESLTSAKQIPVVEFNAVMMGDRVELVVLQTLKSPKPHKNRIQSNVKKLRTIASRN